MKRTSIIVCVLLGMAGGTLVGQRTDGFPQSNPSPGSTQAEKRIFAVLDAMVEHHETYLSVPAADGKALRLLTEAADARNVVEIGTSTGYSGLWLCLALERTGGHLTTIEIDHQRASLAREHFKQAGVEKLVTV